LWVFGAYVSVSNYIHAKNSASWLRENGVIIDSDIIEVRNAGDVVTAGVVEYQVYVRYQYKVNDREFFNSTISFPNPPHFPDRESADIYRRRYPVEGEVAVYYDPRNPAESCLQPGGGSLSSTIGSLLLFAAIAALCIYGLRIIPVSERRHDKG
jgi:hypothetical protein